jgi:hypothetical protein
MPRTVVMTIIGTASSGVGLAPVPGDGFGDRVGVGCQRHVSDVVVERTCVDEKWPIELPVDLCQSPGFGVDDACGA